MLFLQWRAFKTQLVMDKTLNIAVHIDINSSPERIWSVLTEPSHIAKYLYGTRTTTDWKVGSEIRFEGKYQGVAYCDKGVVVENNKPFFLSYQYYSSFSGLEDKIENYSLVIYKIERIDAIQTRLSWIQEGFANEENRDH